MTLYRVNDGFFAVVHALVEWIQLCRSIRGLLYLMVDVVTAVSYVFEKKMELMAFPLSILQLFSVNLMNLSWSKMPNH